MKEHIQVQIIGIGNVDQDIHKVIIAIRKALDSNYTETQTQRDENDDKKVYRALIQLTKNEN